MMLLDWQNWYCGNGNMTKNNPPIYCNSHQNSNDILPRARKKAQLENVYENTILSRKNMPGGVTILDLRLYYGATAIKIVLCGHKPDTETDGIRQRTRNKPTQLWAPTF